MNFDFNVQASGLLSELRDKGQQFPTLVAKGIFDATSIMYQGSKTLLSDLIYNKPIPTVLRFRRLMSGSGWRSAGEARGNQRRFFGYAHSGTRSNRPAWRRTGTLLRDERFYFRGQGAQLEGVIDNKAPYAQARHDLDRPGADGITRRAPWRKKAVEEYGPRSLQAMRAAIQALNS